jgi:hypothetical protein
MGLDSKAGLVAVERELAALERRRDELDRAVARLRRIALWLRQRRPSGRASGGPAHSARSGAPSSAPSLTDGCRAVLRVGDRRGLTPREVKRMLAKSGVEWDRYSNPMAAVHTVLKRLVRQGEASVAIGADGRRRYAARRQASMAITRGEFADEALVRELLEAGSPDEVVRLLARRRTSH